MKHITIFKMLLEQESISQRSLCKKSGMHPSKINRFLNGVADINSSEFFQLLELMPEDFQSRYWQLVIGKDLYNKNQKWDVAELVKSLSPREQISLMRAIVEEEDIFADNSNRNDTEQKLIPNRA